MFLPLPDHDDVTWRLEPEKSYALVVGIDTYAASDIYDTPGLAAQAVDVANRLIDAGVPAGHVHLLMAPLRTLTGAPAGVRKGDVTHGALLDALQELMTSGGQFLWVYWAGHGFQADDGKHRLVLPTATDRYTANIAVADLMTTMRREASCRRQYWTIDACQLRKPRADRLMPVELSGPEVTDVEAWVLTSSRPGEAAPHPDEGGTPFGSAVVGFLDDHPADHWPPGPRAFFEEIPNRLAEALDDPSADYGCTYQSPRMLEPQNHPAIGGRRRRPTPLPLVGWALPPDWRPGAFNTGCSSATQCRLDLRLVADRSPHSTVLVEPADADLVADLDAAESTLAAALTRLGVPPRQWIGIDVAAAGPMPKPSGDATSASGFVCRVDAPLATREHVAAVRDAIDAAVRRIDAAHPTAAVVVAVGGAAAVDALLTAALLTDAVPLATRRGATPWRAYTRMRPGSAPAVAEPGVVAAAADLPRLLRHLQHEAHRRETEITWGSALTAACGSTGDRKPVDGDEDVPPHQVAAAVVEARNADEHATSACGPDPDVPEDQQLLCAVRDLLPHLYRPLLRRYAQARTGPGVGVSLGVAALFDEDVEAWMAAAVEAGRDPAHPDSRPPARYGSCPGDAAALHHLRNGNHDRAEEWGQIGTSAAVDEAIRLFRKHPQAPPLLTGRSRAVIAVLARAGIYPDLRSGDLDATQDETWIALAHNVRRRSQDDVDDIDALVNGERGQRAAYVLGLLRVPPEDEPVIHRRVAELRHLLTDLPQEAQE